MEISVSDGADENREIRRIIRNHKKTNRGKELLDEKSLKKIIELSQGEKYKYDESRTWVDLFLDNVRTSPDSIAVTAENGCLTYAELDQESDKLSAALIEVEKIEPNEFVAIRMGRIKEFFVAVLAIHKAGAAYMPIDLEAPMGRVTYMMKDSGARLTLTKQNIDFLCSLNKKEMRYSSRCHPDNYAYMIYTSGSTGEPKGVVIPQKALTNFVHFISHRWNLGSNSRISLHSNFAFDASVEDIFPALTVGGSVFIMPEDIRKETDGVRNYIIKNQINGGCYSTLFGQLLANDSPLDVDYFVLGGEAMTTVPNVTGHIFNTYGPTEFTVDATYYEVEKDRKYENIPIGRPLYNCAAYIVNEKLELLPIGETGELCLAGPSLSLGYWNRPELTKEKFTTLNLGSYGEVKIYRTGDLAHWNEEGQLEFCGRIDNQVKLRGFRVELGEIERCAALFDGSLQCAAVVRKQTLCLYYSTIGNLDERQLLKFIESKLPDFMVPQIITRLETMPITVNGKIDRKALPDPVFQVSGEFVAPETERERMVAGIMGSILEIDAPISVTGDFFELGGDSIKAIRLVNELRRNGYDTSVVNVMRGRSVRKIAETLKASKEETNVIEQVSKKDDWSSDDVKKIKERFENRGEKIERLYPLTPMQEGMLLEHIRQTDGIAYRIADIYISNKIIDDERLEYAIDALSKRHEVLRSAIIYNGVPSMRQAIVNRKIPLTILDMTSSKDAVSEIMKLRSEILKNDFDLENKPITKFVYVKTAGGVGYLIFVTHHIITDGWSFEILMRDLNALLCGEELPQATPGVYEQVVTRRLLFDYDKALDYFKELLDGYENTTSLPTWGVVPPAERYSNDEIYFTLSAEKTKQLSELCKSIGATLSDGVNLAFGMAIGTINHIDDVVFVSFVSGRDEIGLDVSDTVGLFLNSVPVRVDFSDKKINAMQMIRKLRKQATETKAYDRCSLSDIQTAIGNKIKLFGVNLSFENYFEFDEGERILNPFYLQEGHDGSEIGVDALVQPDGSVRMIYIFDPELYYVQEIQRFAYLFENYVTEIIKAPTLPLMRYKHLGDEQLGEILEISRGEQLSVNDTGTWFDDFFVQVEKNPDHPALVDENGNYTYKELECISNAVAGYLIKNHVKEDDFIAVCMGRVKEFIAAVIGIQKAGAAYVPIDPEYPKERIEYMLKDSEAKIILTLEDVKRIASIDKNPEPVNKMNPNGRAYMIYTSGSTGLPKGVVIPHRALNYFVHFIAYKWKLSKKSRIALHSTFSFDAAVEDMFPALTVGGTVFVVPENARKDVLKMRNYISENRINGGCYSTLFGQLLANDFTLDVDYFVLGGEAMTQVPSVTGHIFNTYGPTEFTVDATYFELEKDRKYENIPIGRPVANCACYVVDKNLHILPKGVMGELCLAGPQMALGYWKRDDLTKEKFTFIELDNRKKVKVYRTGDLVRWNEDNHLRFIGRLDNQVKLRGYRVELSEVEHSALQFEGITQAVALVQRDTLCLYYTASKLIEEIELKKFMEKNLAEFMVPGVFVSMDKMPLTPGGKINRKAFQEPDIPHLRKVYVAPTNELEKELCDIFAVVLEMEPDSLGINDDFFELGGNSVRAMKAVLKANINGFTTADLYRLHTPKNIATYLTLQNDTISGDEEERAKREGVPATIGQISMIDYQFVNVYSVMYNLSMLYTFSTDIDTDRLCNAINAAVGNHPALQTELEINDDGIIIQRYKPDILKKTEVIEVSKEDIGNILNGLVKPFRIFREPLLRTSLYRTEDKVYMFIDMYHVIADGVSAQILLEDIALAYNNKPLSEDHYYSWLLNEQQILKTDRYLEAKKYFDELIGDEDWCSVPTLDYDSSKTNLGYEELRMELSVTDMQSAEQRLSASGNILCITAGIMALQEYCHRSDIMVTWLDNNRVDARYERTVGMLFKSLPIAIHLERIGSVKALIAEVGRQVALGFANSACNYMELIPASKVLDDAMEINYLIGVEKKDPLSELGGKPESIDAPDEDLATGERVGVYIDDVDGEIFVSIGYQKLAYADGSMARFLSLFKKHLRSILLKV